MIHANEITAIIGAAGTVGKSLIKALLQKNCTVVALLRKTPLPDDPLFNFYKDKKKLHIYKGVDVTSPSSLDRAFQQTQASIGSPIQSIWNLAAPLSVETEGNPKRAREIVVGGMRNLLDACIRYKHIKKVLFSDSIGSYGANAPRLNVKASWLVS